jgi:hypothetical protein
LPVYVILRLDVSGIQARVCPTLAAKICVLAMLSSAAPEAISDPSAMNWPRETIVPTRPSSVSRNVAVVSPMGIDPPGYTRPFETTASPRTAPARDQSGRLARVDAASIATSSVMVI